MGTVLEFVTGENRHYVDGPFIYTKIGGPTSREIILEYVKIVRGVLATHGEAYLLVNNERDYVIEPGARKALFAFSKEHRVSAFATVGGGAVYRTIFNLMMRALALAQIAVCPTAFFPTDAQARAWLEAHQRAARSA